MKAARTFHTHDGRTVDVVIDWDHPGFNGLIRAALESKHGKAQKMFGAVKAVWVERPRPEK